MATARELVTRWGFDIETDKLTRVEQQLEGIKSRLDAFAAAKIIEGLFNLAQKFSHLGQELQIAATTAGITTDEFQKLAYSAAMSSVGQERLTMAMARFSRILYEARKGSIQAQAAFTGVGFTSGQVKGFRTSQDALFALADRLKAIQDPIKRAAIAQQLLGRGNASMIAWLSQGSAAIKAQGIEAGKLGIILGKDQVEALEHFNNSMQRVGFILRAFSAGVAAQIAPVFDRLIDDFVKFYEANEAIIKLNFTTWLNDVAYNMGFVWAITKNLTRDTLELAKAYHMEGTLLSTTMGFLGWVVALIATVKVVRGFISILSSVWDAIIYVKDAVLILASAYGSIGIVLGDAIFWLAGLAESLGLTTAATWLLNAATAVAGAPFWAIYLAIAALILVGHEFYALFTGKATWLGQFWEWLNTLESIKAIIEFLRAYDGPFGWAAHGVIAAGDKLAERNADIADKRAGGAFERGQNVLPYAGQSLAPQFSANVTMNLPTGLSPESAQTAVKESLQDFWEQMAREERASASLPRKY